MITIDELISKIKIENPHATLEVIAKELMKRYVRIQNYSVFHEYNLCFIIQNAKTGLDMLEAMQDYLTINNLTWCW